MKEEKYQASWKRRNKLTYEQWKDSYKATKVVVVSFILIIVLLLIAVIISGVRYQSEIEKNMELEVVQEEIINNFIFSVGFAQYCSQVHDDNFDSLLQEYLNIKIDQYLNLSGILNEQS